MWTEHRHTKRKDSQSGRRDRIVSVRFSRAILDMLAQSDEAFAVAGNEDQILLVRISSTSRGNEKESRQSALVAATAHQFRFLRPFFFATANERANSASASFHVFGTVQLNQDRREEESEMELRLTGSGDRRRAVGSQ